MKLKRKNRERLNKMSLELWGVSSKWQTILREGIKTRLTSGQRVHVLYSPKMLVKLMKTSLKERGNGNESEVTNG